MSIKYDLKTPKGTKDYGPEDMAIREKMFQTIISVYKKYGAVTIDTPVFELKEFLTGKYGEDSKLIYDLADQGSSEVCSLRYDLTVPFARYVAMNKHTSGSMKRYHIAKVYRRDQPVLNRGRFREFYQCDFDIAGKYDGPMVPDAEILSAAVEVAQKLDIGKFKIKLQLIEHNEKLNHRKILDGIFEVCGVPGDKIRSISSAIDKLDKLKWPEVKDEMVKEKGLEESVADKIGSYVNNRSGGLDVIAFIKQDEFLKDNENIKKGVADLETLFSFLEIYGITDSILVDMSLARGLDYYTGLIFEAVSLEANVGSFAAGGRYDGLVGMFAGDVEIPCVGFSVGVERVFAILSKKTKSVKPSETLVFVSSIHAGFATEKMKIAKELRDANIPTEFMCKPKSGIGAQISNATKQLIPLVVCFGEDEVKEGLLKIKILDENKEIVINRKDLVTEVKSILKIQ